MKKEKITLASDTHRNKKVVIISFAYNRETANLLKHDFAATWSQTKKCWWVARDQFDYPKFKKTFAPTFEIIIPDGKVETKEVVQLPHGYLEKLKRVRYSL